MKADVTWLGEDDVSFDWETNEAGERTGNKIPMPGPSFTTWNGFKLEKGKPVTLDTEKEKNIDKRALISHMIGKSRQNRFFKVENYEDDKPKPKALQPSAVAPAGRQPGPVGPLPGAAAGGSSPSPKIEDQAPNATRPGENPGPGEPARMKRKYTPRQPKPDPTAG